MLDAQQQKWLTDLSADAKDGLTGLLALEELKSELWYMRRKQGGSSLWEPLTNDTKENDRQIKQRIAASESPEAELVLAFVGMVEWRGAKQLMAYLQCFRAGYPQGILCLRHLKEVPDQRYETTGEFLIVGSCQNIWI